MTLKEYLDFKHIKYERCSCCGRDLTINGKLVGEAYFIVDWPLFKYLNRVSVPYEGQFIFDADKLLKKLYKIE